MPVEVQRYLPIRSRATRALIERLKTITFNNGYATEFNHVWVMNTQVERPIDPPEIYLLFGRSIISDFTNTQFKENADIEIWFIIPALTEQTNEEYDIAAYDIIKAIDPCGTPIEDAGYEVWIDVRSHQPHYQTGQEKFIWGRISCEMQYIWLRDNPDRWDVQDLPILKED